MEHHTLSNNTDSGRSFRIPIIAWVLGAGLLIALLAIFVFGVSASTVGTYAVLVLFMVSHFFMHGGHGSHGEQNRQGLDQNGAADDPSKDKHAGHSGGCH